MSDQILVRIDRARMLLAEAKSISDVKQIADVAEAARVYAKRVKAGVATVNYALTVKLRAERKLGEFLKAMPKNKGRRGSGRPKIGGVQKEPPKTDGVPKLADIGITKKQSHVAQNLAGVSDERFEAKIAQVESAQDEEFSSAAIVRDIVPARQSTPKPKPPEPFEDRRSELTTLVALIAKEFPDQIEDLKMHLRSVLKSL